MDPGDEGMLDDGSSSERLSDSTDLSSENGSESLLDTSDEQGGASTTPNAEAMDHDRLASGGASHEQGSWFAYIAARVESSSMLL